VEIYLHSPIRLHGVVRRTGTILPLPLPERNNVNITTLYFRCNRERLHLFHIKFSESERIKVLEKVLFFSPNLRPQNKEMTCFLACLILEATMGHLKTRHKPLSPPSFRPLINHESRSRTIAHTETKQMEFQLERYKDILTRLSS